jgi:hypothetical protein
LTLGFMFQPFLTYLVTPMVGHDAHGQLVVEQCTLMGSKRLTSLAALEAGPDHAMQGTQSGIPEATPQTAHEHHAGTGHAGAGPAGTGQEDHQAHTSTAHEHHAAKEPALDLATTALETPDNSEHCPALTLFKLAGSVQILMPPSIVTQAPDSFVRFIPVHDRLHPTVEFSDYLTRAPPSFS